ncbi:MAG: molybdopterin-dependent oxidoreductase [Abditibacteriales bacterium]|nr:molybdopterin-dependent oxidoreductase [Abditibacteriales bacterium]MDW8366476.1 molybdopterin-dependent oxidoreductase [Abditibacteriales bacterium]
MELSRRKLFKAGLVTGAGAALLQIPKMMPGGAQTFDQLAQTDLHRDLPEEWLPSVCAACAAACPLTLRKVGENIVGIKPGNAGVCARAYTIPQELVHPDRVRTPLKRTGERGKGAFQPLKLDAALAAVADILRRSGTKTAFVVRESAALSFMLLRALGHAIGAAPVLTDEWTLSQGPVDALEQATGWRHWRYDLANAGGVIAFGVDWLQTHPHPVEAQKAFARLRDRNAPIIFVGPRFNLTAMRSHEWLACRVGFEPLVALMLAHLLVQERSGAQWNSIKSIEPLTAALERFDLTDAERKTGVSVRRLREVAKMITSRGGASLPAPQSVLCLGGRGRLPDQWAIVALNALLGNIGKETGGLTPLPDMTFASTVGGAGRDAPPLRHVEDLIARGRDVETFILVGVNPAFTSPAPARWRDALKRVKNVVCLTSLMDETAMFADIVLPLAMPAEREDAYLTNATGTPEVVQAALPTPTGVVSPATLALELAQRLNVPREVFPWNTLAEAAKDVTIRQPPNDALRMTHQAIDWTPPKFRDGTFHLLLETPVTLPRAEGAHLPYLLTTVGPHLREWWTTWVEVNPETAHRLHLHDKDEVIVESQAGAIRARVKTFPGVPPDAVCLPLGLGHRLGAFAQQEGGNPAELVELQQDEQTRVPLWDAQKVNIRRV